MVGFYILSFFSNLKISSLTHRVWFSVFLLAFSYTLPVYSQVNSLNSGNWSSGTTWVGGIPPVAGQAVIINSGHTVAVDINTPTVTNITVNANAVLNILNTATSTLKYSGNLVVAGSLTNNGGIEQTTNGRTFQLTGTGTYIHNPRNLNPIDESIFEKSNEIFSPTSNLIIQKWVFLSTPLGASTRVQQPIEFGNVTLNIPDTTIWEQDDEFSSSSTGFGRIKGTLTVSSGIVRMDDGTGGSIFMDFNDVVIDGTGSVIFSSGPPNRSLTLQTKSFTDISTSPRPTIIMDNNFAPLQWNAIGNVTLGHNFFGINGTGASFVSGDMNIAITGNLSITGGTVHFISKTIMDLNLTVGGTTTISGNPTKVRFIDGNTGNLNFTTNNFNILGGSDNILLGGNSLIPPATGTPTIIVNNDFIINGSTNTILQDADTSIAKLSLRVGHNFQISNSNANFTAARSRGAVTIHVSNNFTHNAGKFIGQVKTLNSAIDSLFVGGAFLMNSPSISDFLRITYGDGNTYFRCMGNYTMQNTATGAGFGFTGIYSGSGNMNFYVGGILTLNAGRLTGIYNNDPGTITGNLTFTVATNFNMTSVPANGYSYFRGIDNRASVNQGTVNFTVGNLQYAGGNFSGYYSCHTSPGNTTAATFTVNGLLQITFPAPTASIDTFSFIGISDILSAANTLRLNLSVAGNFNITGAAGLFVSSIARGREVINIGGDMNFSGGKNSFNNYNSSIVTANDHPVIFSVTGSILVDGGITCLSAKTDTLSGFIGGNLTINLGEFILKGGAAGVTTIDVAGGFSQAGGLFYFHKNYDLDGNSIHPIHLTINSDNNAIGNFSHTGGTMNFDNNQLSTQVFLEINSPQITFGGTGIMTMADPGTNLIFGHIIYGRAGTSQFSRTSNTHSLQQIDQQIIPGCTLEVITGNLQLASWNNPSNQILRIESGGVLNLGTNQVFSNNLQPNSGLTNVGRIITARPQGLYDGTANAAINANGNLNYFLFTSSTVEYNGSDNQVVTGTGVGLATLSSHKYGILDINFNGTPNTEFAYVTNVPTNRSVFVRNKLILTNGELNLDNDHNPTSGGRSIIIERDSLTSISRVNGYIRSEVYDSSASVIWRVNSRVGPRIIPFGYNSSNYIPFTFDLGSGNADTIFVSTYHTPAADNLPYPPPVIQLNGLTGANNSANTVDRFWYLRSSGTSTDANLTFVCTSAELGSIVNPRAQCYIPLAPDAWQYPIQGIQSTISNGTNVIGADYYPSNWWTLAGLLTPLPVTMLDFNTTCVDEKTEIKWSTASEQNNHFFTILKSTNGITYNPIGRVEGNGNTTNITYYNFTDQEVNTKLCYFKIAQTDFDGKETIYGPVLSNPCRRADILDVNVFSSTPEELTVLIKNPSPDKFQVILYSVDGKLITVKTQQLDKGLNVVALPVENLASGIYFVNVRSSTENSTTKVSIGFDR